MTEPLTEAERIELDRLLAGVLLPTFTDREREIARLAARAALALKPTEQAQHEATARELAVRVEALRALRDGDDAETRSVLYRARRLVDDLEAQLGQQAEEIARLRGALKAAQQFVHPEVDRGPAVNGWQNTITLVREALGEDFDDS